MLTPRLTNCKDCSDILLLVKNIDCKLAEYSNALYNNIVFMLNKHINQNDLFALIAYKRILMYKYVNSDYASNYSLKQISSRVNSLTAGCKPKCTNKIITTTTTTTLPIQILTPFNISSVGSYCCEPVYQIIDSVAYHNGVNVLPVMGDICYLDPQGLTFLGYAGEVNAWTMDGPNWIQIGFNGVVTYIGCAGCA